jgi:hypothetical protein
LSTIPYFAYGSNLDPDGMSYRAPSAVPLFPARLPNWRLTFRNFADIEQAPGDEVVGALWLLDAEAERSLDTYEGAPKFYVQRNVRVEIDNGTVDAMTYVMTSIRDSRHNGRPDKWYVRTIIDGLDHWDLPYNGLGRALARVGSACA